MTVQHETLKEAWRRQQNWRTPLPGVVLAPGGACTLAGPSGSAKTDLLYLWAAAFCARPNDRRLLWLDADRRFHLLRLATICGAAYPDRFAAVMDRIHVQRPRSVTDAARIVSDLDPNEFVLIIDGSDIWVPLHSKQQFAVLKQALTAFRKRGGTVCVSACDPAPASWYRLLLYPFTAITMACLEADHGLYIATVQQQQHDGAKSSAAVLLKFRIQADPDGCVVIPQ